MRPSRPLFINNRFLVPSSGMLEAMKKNELIVYIDGKLQTPVHIAFDGETMWLTREQIAALFDTTSQNVGQHIKKIYTDGELEPESTTKKIFGVVENRPNYGIDHYNLDVVISVGYRVSSKVATKFRQWATNLIKQRLASEVAGLSYDTQRVLISDRVEIENNELLGSAKEMGVENPALFFDVGYQGMYKMRMPKIQETKNIGDDRLLDRAGPTELAANEFRITQTNERLRALIDESKLVGNTVALTTHFAVGREVREAIERIGGLAPEDLPPEIENVKDVKKRLSNTDKRKLIDKSEG